jgi:hypothetical protein
MEGKPPHDANPAMGGTPGSRTGEGHEIFLHIPQFVTRTIFSQPQGRVGILFSE